MHVAMSSSGIKMLFETLKKSVLKYNKIIDLISQSASKDWLKTREIATGLKQLKRFYSEAGPVIY